MKVKNGKNRTTENRESGNIRDTQGESGSLGTFSTSGPKHGNDQVGTGRENSEKRNSHTGSEPNHGSSGKIASQLITETEKQLAYHEEQVQFLRGRLEELKNFTENSNEID